MMVLMEGGFRGEGLLVTTIKKVCDLVGGFMA
jgi:hypothetical protein